MAVKAGPLVNLLGATGPASIVTVYAPPGPNVGVVGGYAVWNNGGTILLYGPKTSSGWTMTSPDSSGNTYPASVQLTGIAGYSILSGTGAPSASLGVVGQPAYLDLATGNLYGQKTSSGWPTSYLSLVGQTGSPGAAGQSVLTGSGAPSSSIGVTGQAYVDTTNAALYTKGASAWGSPVTLVGPQGLSLLTGSGAPASNVGTVGQAYLDTAAGALYAAKTASGWPSSPLSLVGQQGVQGNVGQTGATGYSVLFGAGAPSSALAVVGVPGYIDTTALVLYPPVTTAGVWGTNTTPLYATQIRTTTGVPASSVGNVNDIAIDNQGFVWGPKTASGWPATPLVSTVGPAGPQGLTGAAAVLPSDYNGNSFVVQPVSGDSNATRLAVLNASGTVLWSADASGNTTVGGTLSVSGKATFFGALQASSGAATFAGVSASTIAASGAISGQSTLSCVGNATLNAAVSAGSLTVSGATTLAAASATNLSASGTLAVSGATTAAAITSSGLITAPNVTLTSGGGGKLTFADGTTMSTAATGGGTSTNSSGVALSDTFDMGTYWSSNGGFPASYVPFVRILNYSGSFATMASNTPMPYAGNVISIQGWVNGTLSPGTVTFCLYKNGVATTLTATSSITAAGVWSATAGSTISFAAGDNLAVYLKGSSTTINQAFSAFVTVNRTA